MSLQSHSKISGQQNEIRKDGGESIPLSLDEKW